MPSFVIKTICSLLSLAKENQAISWPNRFMFGLGRAKGFYESADALHSSAIAAGVLTENDFAFPSWSNLQTWEESADAAQTA